MVTAASRQREDQARAEVGTTEVGRRTALGLTLAFLAGLAAVAAVDAVGRAVGEGTAEPWPAVFARYAAGLPAVGRSWVDDGPLAADRELLRRMAEVEDDVERGSAFAAAVGPPVRWLQTSVLGAPTEQVVVGRGGWLFLRPGVDLVTGPPFLDPGRLDRRRLEGKSWETPPQPDPLPVLLGLGEQLARRGVRLIVVPAPSKAAVHPERATARLPAAAAPLANPSLAALRSRLEEAGIAMLDPAPLLAAAARQTGRPQYLRGDSHWRPEAVERVAAALAAEIRPWLAGAGPRIGWRREPGEAADEGDLVRLLGLPGWQRRFGPERVTVRRVLGPGGTPWRPDRAAPVLVLGDSFTNVFSEPGLGWGSGAGLAEQLAFELGLPVDRIAVNAGGAHASRERLAQALRYSGPGGGDRLATTRVVVYELAARELAVGDWRVVELPFERGVR
jgi:alginate O-acetyltransferase complex protein AlgJ